VVTGELDGRASMLGIEVPAVTAAFDRLAR
jgi:hypothetical protein